MPTGHGLHGLMMTVCPVPASTVLAAIAITMASSTIFIAGSMFEVNARQRSRCTVEGSQPNSRAIAVGPRPAARISRTTSRLIFGFRPL